MIIFIVNMVSISMVMMGAIVLIILRERTDTQILLAGITLEATVALGSLMWIRPDQLDSQYLAIRVIGRTIEAMAMWYVITSQVRGIQRAAINPTMTEVISKEIGELKEQIAELKKQDSKEEIANATTH